MKRSSNCSVLQTKRQNLYFLCLLLSLPNISHCCSSSRSKSSRTEVSNEIETFPTLFTAINDVTKERNLCPKSYPPSACKVVQVNLEALAAPKMNFPVLFSESSLPPDTQIMLKKATEEGLKMVLSDPTSPATATVTYKVRKKHFRFCLSTFLACQTEYYCGKSKSEN